MATRQTYIERVTIPSGSYTHALPIDLTTRIPESLILPSLWTAAAISFSGSAFSTNPSVGYGWLSGANGKVIRVSPVQANGQYRLTASWFSAVNYLYLVSGDLSLGVGGLVNQAADRQLILVCRDRNPVTIIGG